jgi:hypothetical protein
MIKYLGRIKEAFRSIALINRQTTLLDNQAVLINHQVAQLTHVASLLNTQAQELALLKSQLNVIEHRDSLGIPTSDLAKLSDRLRRNFLPNDSALMQKLIMLTWQSQSGLKIGYQALLAAGFRVFSQSDEDGILLRIFSQIGVTNQFVLEIGSNCSDSDIGVPENLSTNLIVNHGWHGVVFEIDPVECERTRYFFARDFSTKHFHAVLKDEHTYFSPLIVQKEINPNNINQVLAEVNTPAAPDLMIIDIDGGDFDIISNLTEVRPRVLVVEFEKRFGGGYSVVQSDKSHFSKKWPQSGAASLSAWEKLLMRKGYSLCAIGTCGFNAFFVRSDVAEGKIDSLESTVAFKEHPILSKVSSDFWETPDETWVNV